MSRVSLVLISIVFLMSINGDISASGLGLVGSIPLPGVRGRLDHMAVDTEGQRLFVAAHDNGTVEVVDLAERKSAGRLVGLSGPQGVLFLSGYRRLFVSEGGTGECRVYDSGSLVLLKKLEYGSDADNLRYDSATRTVWLGYGSGGLAVIDAASCAGQAEILLGGHPEAFELERDGGSAFFNVPDLGLVGRADRKSRTIVKKFFLRTASANFSLCLDEAGERVFVGCRFPPRLLVLDAGLTGVVATIGLDGDQDDIWFDPRRNRLYVSCGSGYIDVVAGTGRDSYRLEERIRTRTGARTSLFVPERGLLYLAVPASPGKSAEIRIYRAN